MKRPSDVLKKYRTWDRKTICFNCREYCHKDKEGACHKCKSADAVYTTGYSTRIPKKNNELAWKKLHELSRTCHAYGIADKILYRIYSDRFTKKKGFPKSLVEKSSQALLTSRLHAHTKEHVIKKKIYF